MENVALVSLAISISALFISFNARFRVNDKLSKNQKKEIIKVVGNAIANGDNGFVGVYPNIGKITLLDCRNWDNVKAISAILRYLDVDFVTERSVLVKRKKNK